MKIAKIFQPEIKYFHLVIPFKKEFFGKNPIFFQFFGPLGSEGCGVLSVKISSHLEFYASLGSVPPSNTSDRYTESLLLHHWSTASLQLFFNCSAKLLHSTYSRTNRSGISDTLLSSYHF